ncbi:hypothetical protein F5883DRAFT_435110, partial [Diaporthe sp. PMI_573]
IGVLGTFTVFITLHPKFQGTKYRLFQVLTFVGTGLSGFAPLIHGLNVFGMSASFYAVSHAILHARGKLTLTHVVLETRFPESLYRGKFNMWGSHSIFHILVVCAAVIRGGCQGGLSTAV